MKRLWLHWWERLDPSRDSFPRGTYFKVWWWVKCRTDINYIYFRIHGHWPVNHVGHVTSLKDKGRYEKDC